MNTIIYILLFFLGTILGSFYGVVGSRLPKNESIVKPNSHCEYCGKKLKWYELIPIFSFLFQKGRCSKCHKKLSYLYPISELLSGILFCLSFWRFGYSYSFLISIILSSLVVIIFVSDIQYMIILDSPLVISILIIFIGNWYLLGIKQALLSIGSGLLSFLTMFLIGKLGDAVFKKESLGGGDIKLSFLFGMILGFKMSIVALVLSTFLALPYAVASLFMKEEHVVPFGPFLISALWLVFFFYDKFQNILIFLFQI